MPHERELGEPGSAWIEGDTLCYIDGDGNKHCGQIGRIGEVTIEDGPMTIKISDDGVLIVSDADEIDFGSGFEVRESAGTALVDLVTEGTENNLGNDQAGIIIHTEPGQTKDGYQIDKDNWVEIYGEQVHVAENI